LAIATVPVWRLQTGACGDGACGFRRYRMPPPTFLIACNKVEFVSTDFFFLLLHGSAWHVMEWWEKAVAQRIKPFPRTSRWEEGFA